MKKIIIICALILIVSTLYGQKYELGVMEVFGERIETKGTIEITDSTIIVISVSFDGFPYTINYPIINRENNLFCITFAEGRTSYFRVEIEEGKIKGYRYNRMIVNQVEREYNAYRDLTYYAREIITSEKPDSKKK